jgi:hypothetical protein
LSRERNDIFSQLSEGAQKEDQVDPGLSLLEVVFPNVIDGSCLRVGLSKCVFEVVI